MRDSTAMMGRQIALSCLFAWLLLSVQTASATQFNEDFTLGLRPLFWVTDSNQPLYTVDDSQGDIRVMKPSGGSSSFQYFATGFVPDITGDFTISVEYRDASIDRVNGTPGNQIQLNTSFGGQSFSVVRSDEASPGDNYHVWDGSFRNDIPTTASHGVLRITRVGTTVSGYFDNTLIYSQSYNDTPVTGVSLTLQNNDNR